MVAHLRVLVEAPNAAHRELQGDRQVVVLSADLARVCTPYFTKQGLRRLHHDREARELVADDLDRLAVVQLDGEEVGVEEDVADLEGVAELEAA